MVLNSGYLNVYLDFRRRYSTTTTITSTTVAIEAATPAMRPSEEDELVSSCFCFSFINPVLGFVGVV